LSWKIRGINKMTTYEADNVDVVVVGAGHAGCEAALASARMGMSTIVFGVSLDSIGMMPCNPSIGGSSKGHLVREIDALGGEMGINADKTFIQSKMLNTAKGPAVHSLRAQADKFKYSKEMKKTLESTENLLIRQGEVSKILLENKTVIGVQTTSGAIYKCRAVVLCTGTYLKARCLFGDHIVYTGPNGLMAANNLTDSLKEIGIDMMRFKTGTPARIDRKSVDFSKMEPQYGDEKVVPFSFETPIELLEREQVLCYLTYTNEKTHEIIRANLNRSPLYAGIIEGTGTRYCPSIEDKVVRFADKERHQIFIEPEGEETDELYIQGMSTSLPEDVQVAMYRTLPGLENCKFMRTAYAIEYDCIDATQLKLSLEFKDIKGLFSSGQINGSSGYEEAAAQGLIGGINAALYAQDKDPLILYRSDGYIGVLIDDLVTKGTKEPYRMMTSRSEYRLLLRQDNADIRLTQKSYLVGLASQTRYNRMLQKVKLTDEEIARIEKTNIAPTEKVQEYLSKNNSTPLKSGIKLDELLKRPELTYKSLAEIDETRPELPILVQQQAEVQIKYEGYIKRQIQQVEQFKKLEKRVLPEVFDYTDIKGLRLEAQQKLNKMRPMSIGHASRISGVSPADISVLLVYLEGLRRSNIKEIK